MDNAKSYIFYTELTVIGESMQCVYLIKEDCCAQPVITDVMDFYKPTEDEKRDICLRDGNFLACPRLRAYQTHLGLTLKK